MDLIELVVSGGLHRTVILRRYSSSGDDVGRRVARELAAMRVAAAGGVSAPELVWVDENGIFEEEAIVISHVDGHTVTRPGGLDDWADQIAIAAAQIHSVTVDPETRRGLNDLERFVANCIAETEPPEKFMAHPFGVRLWERRQELLGSLGRSESTFVHADFWVGNTLWRDNRLVAVIDWEDAGFGDPLLDVADCANDMRFGGFDREADQFVSRYVQESGSDLASLPLWTIIAQTHPLPDIARWLPSFQAMGWPDMTVDELRERHRRMIERALAETR